MRHVHAILFIGRDLSWTLSLQKVRHVPLWRHVGNRLYESLGLPSIVLAKVDQKAHLPISSERDPL
jgi:hypothetical protein